MCLKFFWSDPRGPLTWTTRDLIVTSTSSGIFSVFLLYTVFIVSKASFTISFVTMMGGVED